jgi:hypothetical protein
MSFPAFAGMTRELMYKEQIPAGAGMTVGLIVHRLIRAVFWAR